jgi:hypothetical protein
MTTKNLKLRIEDLVVYVVKMYIKPVVQLWVWVWLLLLLTTAAVEIWVPSGAGWTPLVSALSIWWVFFAVTYAVLIILGSWSRHIVDRRTHDRQELS